MFVEFTVDKKREMFNILLISRARSLSEGGTMLYVNGTQTVVAESYEDVRRKLRNASRPRA